MKYHKEQQSYILLIREKASVDDVKDLVYISKRSYFYTGFKFIGGLRFA